MYIIYKLYETEDLLKIPKYIGITATSLNTRLKRHITHSKTSNGKLNWPKINWINSVNGNINIEPIDFANSQQEAFDKEIYYIDKFLKEGIKLKNATLGGEGNRQVTVQQFDINGNFIKLWPSIASIEKELGLSNSHLSSCCKGRSGRKRVGGFVWRYENDSFDKHPSIPHKGINNIKKKNIYQIDDNGDIIKTWEHSQLIENELGFFRTSINSVCRNIFTIHKQRKIRLRKSNGFHWCYESDKDIVQSLLKSKSIEQVDN